MKFHSFSITQDHIVNLGIALFFSLAAIFLLVRFVPFFFAPQIILAQPEIQSRIAHSDTAIFAGSAKFASSLTLNGEEVYIRKTGRLGMFRASIFEKEVKLEEGMNLLVLTAENRFGRKSEIVRRAVYIKN